MPTWTRNDGWIEMGVGWDIGRREGKGDTILERRERKTIGK